MSAAVPRSLRSKLERSNSMRGTRMLAAGLAASLMVAVTALGTAAQTPPPDALAPASVTGTLGAGEGDPTPGERSEQDGIVQTRGFTMSGLDVTSSDPRLAGEYSYAGNSDEYAGGVRAQAGSVAIRDDLGAWVGTSTEILGAAVGDIETILLAGEGAYAGLTAYLIVDWSQPTRPFKGIIFAGEMPEPPAIE
jgi:hypothetical protein